MRTFAPESEDDDYGFNPLHNPAKCGLQIVAQLETDEAYEFDTILVVRDEETGALYAGHDSGCSCPMPFESFKGLGDFVEIRTEEDFERLVREHGGSSYRSWKPGDVLDAARNVREALR